MAMRTNKQPGGERAYLAACTIYRDHAEYLAEWIEFHLLVGVEHFFLYDNGSVDDHQQVLAPYVAEGLVTVHGWPGTFLGRHGRPRLIVTAFEHCAGHHGDDARWIAFIDIDEFVFSPTGVSLAEVLRDYEEHPGVLVNRAEFGPSGHETRPAGLVIESYVQRRAVFPDDLASHKSIVDPRRVERATSAHSFVYRGGSPVNEQGRRVDMRRYLTRSPVTFERLRVHHYWSRSEEERRAKAELWQDASSQGKRRNMPSTPVAGHEVTDETLISYAPAVREALARRSGQARP